MQPARMDVSESIVVIMMTSLQAQKADEKGMSYKVELSLEYLLVHPFVEIIERGIHHQSAKANGQGEEHLGNGRIPDMRI